MMAERRVKYRFVLPKNVYCGGQTIKGQLHIESPSPVLLSNLQVRLRGQAKVQLEREGNGIRRRMYQTETYLDKRLGEPVERELHHARHWFCCVPSKDILFKAWLDKPEVIMGDTIPFHAKITNNSDIFVKSSYITLIATWVFHAMDETEVKSGKIKSFKKVNRGAIPPGESMTWGDNDEPLVLPENLTPTGPPNCSIMEVSYEFCTYRHGEEIVHLLQFTVVPRGMFRSMKVRLPLTAKFGLTQSDLERLAAKIGELSFSLFLFSLARAHTDVGPLYSLTEAGARANCRWFPPTMEE
ncbi:hypothetical protein C0Q70_04125 [Pomacea canaliculata]|uniref:Arrestin C-terminal-like domain-containing protein n=1 Tax=Pomacea canaliculata TaxID=400727 RepID=A0A2T7PUQ7_POMCA|nr:hypothetical protein C0Q70_04125 [Pomacea canaliculata]